MKHERNQTELKVTLEVLEMKMRVTLCREKTNMAQVTRLEGIHRERRKQSKRETSDFLGQDREGKETRGGIRRQGN